MVNYTIVAWQRKKGSLISEAIYAHHVLCSTSARCQKPHGFVSLKVIKKNTKQLQCSVHCIAHWHVRFSNDNNLGIFFITNYNLPGYLAEGNGILMGPTNWSYVDWRLLGLPILGYFQVVLSKLDLHLCRDKQELYDFIYFCKIKAKLGLSSQRT